MESIKKNVRILFIIDNYPPHIGGIGIFFEQLIARYLRKGYKIGVITYKHIPTLANYQKQGNLEVRRIPCRRKTFLRHACRIGWNISKNYDIIHTSTYLGALPAKLLSLWRHIPIIITVHEVFGPKLWKRYKKRYAKIYQWFEQIVFRFTYDSIVCVSQHTQHKLRKLYKLHKKHLVVINNGVDQDTWHLDNKDAAWIERFQQQHKLSKKFVGLYCGSSQPAKGLTYLVKSIPAILKKTPHFHAILNIVPSQKDYRIYQLVKKLDLYDHITLLHGLQATDLVNLVLTSDALIIPSLSEGFGLLAAEVSQLQHPLIISPNGALPEVSSGKVIQLKNLQKQAFADAVEQAVKKKWQKISVKHFDWKHCVHKYEQVYLRHLQTNRRIMATENAQ